MTPFDGPGKEAFEIFVGKGDIACTSNFSFPTIFSTLSKTELIIFVTFNLSSANALNLVWSKILSCGNGLKGEILLVTNYFPFCYNAVVLFSVGCKIIWCLQEVKN